MSNLVQELAGHKDLVDDAALHAMHLSPAATFNAIRLLDARVGAGQRGDIVETDRNDGGRVTAG